MRRVHRALKAMGIIVGNTCWAIRLPTGSVASPGLSIGT